MTLSGFIAMPRKPGKTKVGQILKNIGFKDKGASGNMWVFGKTRFRVDVVDFRDDLRDQDIFWVEEVGWQDNWAVRIQVNHSNRTDENYIFWHALLVILSDCFGVREIWLDGGSGIPQQPYTLRELFPELKSDEGEDLAEESDFGPAVINQVQPHPSELPDIEPEPKPEPEPVPVPVQAETSEAPQLVPAEVENESEDNEYDSWGWADDDDDEDDDSWDDDDDDDDWSSDLESEDTDEDEDEDEGVDVITDW